MAKITPTLSAIIRPFFSKGLSLFLVCLLNVFTFVGVLKADTVPALSNITDTSVTISWTTDQAANSRIDYGVSPIWGNVGGTGNDSVQSHSQTVTGLTPGTLYHIRARSQKNGYSYISADQTFTTLIGTALPTIKAFSSNSSVAPGGSTKLLWSISGATGVQIDNGLGQQGSLDEGFIVVTPLRTTTYTITATNLNGSASAQTTVTFDSTLTAVPPTNPSSSGPTIALAIFPVQESFGVSHSNQIIDFDYSGPYYNNMYMLDGSTEVPFQILSNGKIAVRTSLSPNTSKTFTLMSGRAATAFYVDQVTLTANGLYYQLTNGKTGVRILKPGGQTRTIAVSSISVTANTATLVFGTPADLQTAVGDADIVSANLQGSISGITGACSYLNGRSFNLGKTNSPSSVKLKNVNGINCSGSDGNFIIVENRLAPIQGVQMADGQWSPSGNKIESLASDNSPTGLSLNATAISTTVLDNGPLKTVVKVSYQYNLNGPLSYGSTPLHPAGTGYFTSTITLEAGQPSILIEDDTDMNLDYKVNVYPQVQPDQGRYSGFGASAAAYGYEENQPSVVYTGIATGNHDGYRNFDYSTSVSTSYVASASTVPFEPEWNIWVPNTGRYWMLYRTAGAAASPVVGAFISKPSRAIGNNNTGFSPYVLTDDGAGSRSAGFEFLSARRDAAAGISSSSRYNWGIFVGTKGADLSSPLVVQNINRQMNLHGGINLNKIYRYQLAFSDPDGGYGRLFNDASLIQGIIARLRAGGADATNYYNYLYNAETSARTLVDMWKDGTGAKTHLQVGNIEGTANYLLGSYVNGYGVLTHGIGYWEGAGMAAQQIPYIDSVLADPTLSVSDKAKVKSDASLFAYLIYDNDFVPFDGFFANPSNALSYGNLNMYSQYLGFRNEFALSFPQHVLLQPFAIGAMVTADQALQNMVNTNGASACSPHYSEPCFEPTLVSLLQAKMVGTDYFGIDQPRMNNLGEFVMQLTTPPEVRFKITPDAFSTNAILRKDVELGDGSTEGHAYTGIIAQGLRSSNPPLAARLMGAWIASGKVHSNFAGTTLTMINEKAPAVEPNLKSATFPGYMSVLRNGWNSQQESAAWIINGDWLNANAGHRHDDRGNVILYSLKAPLTVNWSSFYTPAVGAGGNMTSIVMPDSAFTTVPWNGDNQPNDSFPSGWNTSTSDLNNFFSNSAVANGKMVNSNGLTWERKLYSISPDPLLPVILIKDTFGGSNPNQFKVITLNLMSQGAVVTPAGSILPPVRLNTLLDGTTNALPSTSQTIMLAQGVNKFSFTGQTWPQHPTQGIDWDLYTIADEAQQAVIGNWGHNSDPTTEAAQYRTANGVNFSETQDILRVRGRNNFWTVILPFNKGSRPQNSVVSQDSATTDLIITRAGETIRANDNFYSYRDSNKSVLTAFDDSAVTAYGISISGGPTEIVMAKNQVSLSFSGGPGVRNFKLPGGWQPSAGVSRNGSSYSYNFDGDSNSAIVLTGSSDDDIPPNAPTNLRMTP